MPVSKCTAVVAAEEMTVPVRCKQDSWGASVFAADIDPGPVTDFLGALCYRGPTEMEDSRIPDPGASCNTSDDVDVAYTMGTDVWAPENVVVTSRKGVRSDMMCRMGFDCQ